LKIAVVTEQPGKRLHYAASILFRCDTIVIPLREWNPASKGAYHLVVSFGCSFPESDLSIPDSGWLRDGQNDLPEIRQGSWAGIPTLFDMQAGNPSFDLFAACFFLASRIEEYHVFNADPLGRFEAGESLCGRLGLLSRPLIDEWRTALFGQINSTAGRVLFATSTCSGEMTIDVDSAFAYRHKGFFRTLGGIGKDVMHGEISNLIRRISTLLHFSIDHYDTYTYIREQCDRRRIVPRWFFLLADFGSYDKNVPHTSRGLRKLIRDLSGIHPVGIHPGVGSHLTESILHEEVSRLTTITERTITESRQHYLLLRLPETYRRLIRAGIRHDYSMGYATTIGFRMGTSLPVFWYDLENEEQTTLELIPFCAMDTTLRKYMKHSPEEAIEVLRELKEVTRRTGGRYTLLWHNESLSDAGEWNGWRAVFEAALDHFAREDSDSSQV